jgi:hypothetical protein
MFMVLENLYSSTTFDVDIYILYPFEVLKNVSRTHNLQFTWVTYRSNVGHLPSLPGSLTEAKWASYRS